MDKRKLIKRGVPVIASIILLSATTIAAAGDRLVMSQGYYKISGNDNTVIIDTDDIENNARAIAALQGQLGGLNLKYATEKEVSGSGDDVKGYYWSQDSNGDWVKIGAVGSAVPTDVLSGKKFSSEYGVDVEGEMPVPTSAITGTCANPSQNTSASSPNVAISNSNDTTSSHTEGTSSISIGVGQQITIPHGYYNKDIVIKNGVSNKGALNWNPSSSTSKSVSAGYYTSGTLSSAGAYQAGYSKGVADGKSKNAKITYTVRHTHGDYCYPIPTAQYSSSHKDGGSYKRSVTCSVCGAYFSHTSGGGWPSDEEVYGPYYKHLVNGRCTAKGYQCGKSGNRTTTDVSSLVSGDSIVSANIQF